MLGRVYLYPYSALYAASSADLGHARAFRTYACRGSSLNPTLVEAICATMSIPSLFLPTMVGPRMRQQEFVGGAIGASNPTRELLNEAASIFGKDRRVAQIISIGAGMPRVISLESSGQTIKAGQPQIIQGLGADREIVAKELSTRLFTVDAYLRLNVDRGMEYTSITDWSSLGKIESHTSTYVESAVVAEALETSLGHMRAKIGSITLGHISAYNLYLIRLCNNDVWYRSLEQCQNRRKGSTSRFTVLRRETHSMGADGAPPCVISAFISANLSHHRNGRMWQDAISIILLARASKAVSNLPISSVVSLT